MITSGLNSLYGAISGQLFDASTVFIHLVDDGMRKQVGLAEELSERSRSPAKTEIRKTGKFRTGSKQISRHRRRFDTNCFSCEALEL